VITDTVYGFAIVAASRNPRTFVVPSDPGFVRLLNTPADVATLELEIPNDGDGQPNWRLYRVNEPVPEA
jgi:hypothetical protein